MYACLFVLSVCSFLLIFYCPEQLTGKILDLKSQVRNFLSNALMKYIFSIVNAN